MKFRFSYLLSLLIIASFFSSCKGQDKTQYWTFETVQETNKALMHGVTLSYMDQLAKQNMHLQTEGESVIVDYPYQKKIDKKSFKTLANFKLFKDQKEALDSITGINEEDGKLIVKFKYSGSATLKNFEMIFKSLTKEEYFESINKIKWEKKSVENNLKPLVLIKLSLNQKLPEYFNLKNLKTLSENSDNIDYTEPSINKNDRDKNLNFNYKGLGVIFENEKFKPVIYANIPFEGLEFLWESTTKKVEGMSLYNETETHQKQILSIFNAIQSEFPNAKFSTIGLPEKESLGKISSIGNKISTIWETNDQAIMLKIEVPEEVIYAKIEKNIALPINYTAKDEFEVFKQILAKVKKAPLKIVVVSTKVKEISRGHYSGGSTGDYADF